MSDQPQQRWFIDLDWLERNNRSFFALARGCLCPKCQKRLKTGKKEGSAADIMSAIKDCCSRKVGFITWKLPVMEGIFRLFLANGNQLLDLDELATQLSQWRGGSPYGTSPEILSRLLESGHYYGLKRVQG